MVYRSIVFYEFFIYLGMRQESLSDACKRIREEAQRVQWAASCFSETIDIDYVEVGESEQDHEIRKLLYAPTIGDATQESQV